MARSRIYQNIALSIDDTVALDASASHHLAVVLRAKPQDQLILFNGQGGEYLVEVSTVKKKQVQIKVLSFFDVNRESPVVIHLAQGISKGDRMDYAIQKSVELGVTEITPVYSDHCDVKRNPQRNEKKVAHWHKVMLSACEQSGRTTLATLHPPQLFSEWISNRHENNKLILHPEKSQQPAALSKEAQDAAQTSQGTPSAQETNAFALAIGPEGGFSETEVLSAQKKNFQCLTLGPRVLRTETAPAAAIAILQHTYGDY